MPELSFISHIDIQLITLMLIILFAAPTILGILQTTLRFRAESKDIRLTTLVLSKLDEQTKNRILKEIS